MILDHYPNIGRRHVDLVRSIEKSIFTLSILSNAFALHICVLVLRYIQYVMTSGVVMIKTIETEIEFHPGPFSQYLAKTCRLGKFNRKIDLHSVNTQQCIRPTYMCVSTEIHSICHDIWSCYDQDNRNRD
jgi:hypothetical protein